MIDLISHLDNVLDRGKGQYLFSCGCPIHQNGDKNRSGSAKQLPDGRWLIHCFAGGSPDEILSAVGLELADLFPDRLEPSSSKRSRWNPRDLLLVIKQEAMVMEIAASRFETLMPDEVERVILAGQRIRTALEVANVG